MTDEEKLEDEIKELKEKLEKKQKELSDKIEKVDVYFHREYQYNEYIENYPELSDEQIQELYDAYYEVHLYYNFKTKKFEIADD